MTLIDKPKVTTQTGTSNLSSLFKPRVIALVGASNDPFKIGGRPLRYMAAAGSEIKMYPVNPMRATVQGYKAYPTVQAIPEQVDQIILAVPAHQVEAAVADGLAAGARSIVMFSGGFAETGVEGIIAQQRLVETIRAAGARLLGPNAMGLFNTQERIFSTFSSALDRGIPELGRVSVVSQSGAVGSYIQNLLISRGVKLAKFIATGNEADLEASECLQWLAEDPDTDTLVVYLETCRDGEGLKRALLTARRYGKPVIMLKAGRTEAGQSVAASHTGAMAGSTAVFDAVMESTGVLVARTLPELVDLTYTCANGVAPHDNSLAIITISGGIGVMATDAAVEIGLDMPPMPETALTKIREILPLAEGRNPLDTTAATIGDRTIFMCAVESMLESRPYGSVMLFVGNAGLNAHDPNIMRDGLTILRNKFPNTQLAICTQSTPENARCFEATGWLVFEDPEACIRSFAAVARLALQQCMSDTAPLVLPTPTRLPNRLDEIAAADILREFGVPFARCGTATTAEQAVIIAEDIGYPVVLKIRSPDIAHKSELGGVKVNLSNARAVRKAFTHILKNVARGAPEAEILGVTVNELVTGGHQVILGTHLDPTFGPMIMVGLGGIYTEVMNDTAMRPAPVSTSDALSMIKSLNGFPILEGARGMEKVDIDALAEAVSALSAFAAAQGDTLEGAEVNPLVVRAKGCIGLDALIISALR